MQKKVAMSGSPKTAGANMNQPQVFGPLRTVERTAPGPSPSLDGFAGKGSQKLSDYYEKLGANYLGSVESQAFKQPPNVVFSTP